MKYFLSSSAIQDNYLTPNHGRIVIYGDKMLFSRGPSQDHNDLLRALASRYNLDRDEVIAKAIRLYYLRKDNSFIISERRKLDYEMLMSNLEFYSKIIKSNLK